MKNKTGFTCCICSQPIDTGYVSLDRRIETLSLIDQGGKPTTVENIATCQTMFMYCSAECWHQHEPDLTAELQLKTPYPASGFVTPCSRCGAPVNRTQPYVAYTVSELEFTAIEPQLIARCLDDDEFAVLCRNCDEPDLPDAAVEAANKKANRERIT